MKQSYRDKHNENNIRNLRCRGTGHFTSNIWTTPNNLVTQYAVPSTGNSIHNGNMGCNRSHGNVGSWNCRFSEEQITLQG